MWIDAWIYKWHMNTHLHMWIATWIHTCVYVYIYTDVRMNIWLHVHIYMHTYPHVCIHTDLHMCDCVGPWVCESVGLYIYSTKALRPPLLSRCATTDEVILCLLISGFSEIGDFVLNTHYKALQQGTATTHCNNALQQRTATHIYREPLTTKNQSKGQQNSLAPLLSCTKILL